MKRPVSRQGEEKNAQWIRSMMEKRKIETEILKTYGSPVVYGKLNVDGVTRTLMFYANYDGQPVDSFQWTDTGPLIFEV